MHRKSSGGRIYASGRKYAGASRNLLRRQRPRRMPAKNCIWQVCMYWSSTDMQHIFLIHFILSGGAETGCRGVRLNTAYGMLLPDRDNWKKVKIFPCKLWSTDLEKSIRNSEVYYYDLGLTLFYQEKNMKPMMDSLSQHVDKWAAGNVILWQPCIHEKTIFLRWNLWKKDWSKTVITLRAARGLKASILRKLGCTEQAENGSWKSWNRLLLILYLSMRKFFVTNRKNRITERQLLKAKWETSTRTLFRQPLTIYGRRLHLAGGAGSSDICDVQLACSLLLSQGQR